jgi:hypothetical protein
MAEGGDNARAGSSGFSMLEGIRRFLFRSRIKQIQAYLKVIEMILASSMPSGITPPLPAYHDEHTA